MSEWIVGRDEILKYCAEKLGFHSWQSVRYWRKKYKLPIRYLPNGKPFFITHEIITWSVKYDELRQKFSPPL